MKNVILTGGCGFIGTNLIKRLSNNNHKEYCENIVVSIDDYSTGSGDNEIECNGVQYFGGDISKVTDYSNIIDDCDIIFHLAAKARIQPSLVDPLPHIKNNFVSTLNVLEYARQNNIPVVYAGSSSFWGGVYKNPYTFSKWQGEELCKMYEQIYGLNVTICRFYNVYGDYMPTEGEYRTVLPIFLEQYKNGKPLTITGDGEQRRDFTHVDDITKALESLITSNENNEDAWELGTGVNYSINEVASMFVERFNTKLKYVDDQPGNYRETLRKDNLSMDKLDFNPSDKLYRYIMSL